MVGQQIPPLEAQDQAQKEVMEKVQYALLVSLLFSDLGVFLSGFII